MGQSVSHLPFVTTTAISFTGSFAIDCIYWYNPANIGDTVVLVDAVTGAPIWQGRCEAPNQSQIFYFKSLLTNGLNVSTITSGTLYVYPAKV